MASQHEALCRDGGVAPHGFAPLVGPDHGVVLDRCTPRGQQWTPTLMLPHRRDGLSALLREGLWTFRKSSMCRHMHRELTRNALLDVTIIILTTTCRQRNYSMAYSRCINGLKKK